MHHFTHYRELAGNPADKKERLRVDEIMTPSEVAALLKIHVKTVYKLVEKGALPGNRIGRSWRFNKSDILNLVSDKRKRGPRIIRSSFAIKSVPKKGIS